MKNNRFLFIIILISTIFICERFVLSDDIHQLYITGMEAYYADDYVSALKYLFAYEQILIHTNKKIDKDILNKVRDAIMYSEKQLQKQLSIKNFEMRIRNTWSD